MTATATTTGTSTTHRPVADGTLAGTWPLLRFALRRERVRLPVWLGALTLVTLATATSFSDLYPTREARQAAAETMGTPAGTAMTGPTEYLADYSFGAMMGHQMIGFMAVMVGLMSILTVVRHTRTEEETGRAELVRATVVGRHAHLAAALGLAVAANVALAVLIGLSLGGLGLEDVPLSSSLLYGAAHAAPGLVFAALAAVTVQVTGYARGATGMALGGVGLAYALRAVGDVGDGMLSWASPIGWAQATYVYVEDRWWPLALAVAAAVALVAVATLLSVRRDVGAGLRQARSGVARAPSSLVGPVGMALRLHRGLLVGFGAGLFLLGAMYGSILGEVEEMLGSIEMLDEALAEIGGASMTESYASMVIVILAIISSIYAVLAALRPRAEETSGRVEPLLATALSRARWLGGHVVIALLGGAAVQLMAGIGIGLLGAVSLEDPALVRTMTGAALAYVPAMWVAAGVAVALVGVAPRARVLAWVVPLYAFLVSYLGQMLQFPAWAQRLSPFGHVPALPAEELAVAPLLGLTAVAAALIAIGLVGMHRRDVHSV